MKRNMQTLECILKRRSIRKYDASRVVEESLLKTIAEAGMVAPTAMHKDPCRFIILNNDDVCKQITEVHPYCSYLLQTNAAILVCADLESSYKDYWLQDAAAATQNILLAATDLGLGSCWCGVYPEESIVNNLKQILNLPKNIVPFSLVVLGYTLEEAEPEDRRSQSKLHFNRW